MSDELAGDPVTVFFSYAPEDEDLGNKLANHLKMFERLALIKSWHARHILPGDERDEEKRLVKS